MLGSEAHRLLEARTDYMWSKLRHQTRLDLLTDLRHQQANGRYLMAGDRAAIRATLEHGQTLNDLGKPKLRRILHERFEYVMAENKDKE
jgi:hypothetical protein